MVSDRPFAQQVKDELAHLPLGSSCCVSAEFSGLIQAIGSLRVSSRKRWLIMRTEHAPTARRAFNLWQSVLSSRPQVFMRRRERLRRRRIYLLQGMLDERLGRGLRTMKVLTGQDTAIPGSDFPLVREQPQECCRSAYLRGLFLGCGSMANPRSRYHLELTLSRQTQAQSAADLLMTFGLSAKVVEHRDCWVAYLKRGEDLADLLRLMGASRALFVFENERIIKELRNHTNRLVNAETANLNKTVESAVRHLQQISKVVQTGGISAFAGRLRELVQMRIDHPEASLRELGEMVDPPLSKSAVQYYFRKLASMAQEADAESDQAPPHG